MVFGGDFMDILEKYGHLIILICLGTMAAVNFSTKDITIRDTVSVIGFVIVFLTVVPLAIYRKNKKNSVAFWLP